jgi:O-antigen/teichoic acid export membrane protein
VGNHPRSGQPETLAFRSINKFRLTISVKRQLFVVHFRQLFVVPHTQLGGAAVFAVILGSFTLAALLIHMTFKYKGNLRRIIMSPWEIMIDFQENQQTPPDVGG